MQQSGIKAGWMDSLLVFLTVIVIGSVCSVVLLRDLDRYWKSVGGALERVSPGAKGSRGGDGSAGKPEPEDGG